jgi:hypothetical protein
MTEVGAYLAIISLLLAVPIALAIKTLLALKGRVTVPLLRVCGAGGTTEEIPLKGGHLEIKPAEQTRGYAIAAPTHTTQPRRKT